jgi:hypothetical protein
MAQNAGKVKSILLWFWFGILEVRKRFFFKKKAPRPGKQKTFGPAGAATQSPEPAVNRSFLLPRAGRLFFKKEALS